jgi:hypothetical protein
MLYRKALEEGKEHIADLQNLQMLLTDFNGA